MDGAKPIPTTSQNPRDEDFYCRDVIIEEETLKERLKKRFCRKDGKK